MEETKTAFFLNGEHIKAVDHPLLTTPIDDIDLGGDVQRQGPARALLKRAGISYIGHLLTWPEKKLGKAYRIGPAIMDKINGYLEKEGLTLGQYGSFKAMVKTPSLAYSSVKEHDFGANNDAIQALLQDHNIQTIGALCQETKETLKKGNRTYVNQIEAYLHAKDLQFGMEFFFTPDDPRTDKIQWLALDERSNTPAQDVKRAFDMVFGPDEEEHFAQPWRSKEKQVFDLTEVKVAAGQYLQNRQKLADRFLEAVTNTVTEKEEVQGPTENVTMKKKLSQVFPMHKMHDEESHQLQTFLAASPYAMKMVEELLTEEKALRLQFIQDITVPVSQALE